MGLNSGGARSGGLRNLGTGIPNTQVGKIDDLEDGDIAEYQQDTARFSIDDATVNQGSFALSGLAGNGTGTPINSNDSFIWSDNIDNVPSRGWEFTYDWFFAAGGGGAQAVVFCVQDDLNYYYAGAHNDNINYIYKVKDGSVEKSATGGVNNYDPRVWYKGEIQIDSSTISFTDLNNNNTVSIDDSEWDTGWFGWVAGEYSSGSGAETIFDDAEVTREL